MFLAFILVCCAVLIWTFAAIRVRRWRARFALSGLAILGSTFTPIGPAVLDWLLVPAESPTQPSNSGQHVAIVVLGGGTRLSSEQTERWIPTADAQERAHEAAKIYWQSVQSNADAIILVSGGNPERHGKTEAAAYYEQLLGLGVPSRAILQETRSKNTFQNAGYSAQILVGRQVDLLYLVTTTYQMRRAKWMFERKGLHPIAVETRPVVSNVLDHPTFIDTPWYHFRLTLTAIHEYGGLVQLCIYSFGHHSDLPRFLRP